MRAGLGHYSRRRLLGTLGLSAATIALPLRASAQIVGGPDGFRVLRARRGTAMLRGPGNSATPIWGYEGIAPGPLLRVRRGDELKVRLANELADPTTVHWHGLRVSNGMDGVPHLTQAPLAPGTSFDYRFTPLDAGTFWYHAPPTAVGQIERGLHGVLIVDEPEHVDVDHDVVLALSDWRLNADGIIDEASFGPTRDAVRDGRVHDHFTVNGMPAFDIAVKSNERIRLRLVNTTTERVVSVRVDRHATTVMAFDGQPAEPFVASGSRVTLGPGNRADLFVDAALAPGATAPIQVDTGRGEAALARFVYQVGAAARPTPRNAATPLPANPLPQKMNFASALKMEVPLEGRAAMRSFADPAVDGHGSRPLFTVKRGRTVMLAFANRTTFAHAMHVHGHPFRLLDRLDDGWKPFWLDTVLVPPQQTWRIAFVADNPGKWGLDCRILDRQQGPTTAWFEVT